MRAFIDEAFDAFDLVLTLASAGEAPVRLSDTGDANSLLDAGVHTLRDAASRLTGFFLALAVLTRPDGAFLVPAVLAYHVIAHPETGTSSRSSKTLSPSASCRSSPACR